MAHIKKLELIYVDLDVLLDTRLGTLAILDKTIAEKVAIDPNYRTRRNDEFENVDLAKYKELYKNRDVTTLQHSMLTQAVGLVRRLVGLLAEQAVVRPYHDGSKIVVNVHPYKLTREELEELEMVIAATMQGIAPVEIVCISTQDLTPRHCKDSYAIMIKYDYEEWMNLQADAFKTTRLPDVQLLVPAIYFVKTPSDDEMKTTIKETMHPIKALEMLASPLIRLTLLDVAHFSLLKPN